MYVCTSWAELQGNWIPLLPDKICMSEKGIKRIDLQNNAGAGPEAQPACFTCKAYSFQLDDSLKFFANVCIFFFICREMLLLAHVSACATDLPVSALYSF